MCAYETDIHDIIDIVYPYDNPVFIACYIKNDCRKQKRIVIIQLLDLSGLANHEAPEADSFILDDIQL